MPLPKLKLISHKLCPYVQRARIVLAEKMIPHEIAFIDLANKPQWFLDLSPLGKVPVLLVDGAPLFESAAIVEYLDEITEGSMQPQDAFERARHRAWIEFASNILNGIAGFYCAKIQSDYEAKTELLRSRFDTVEKELNVGPYFDGDRFSLVDAAFGPVFRYFDVLEMHGDFSFFANTPKVRSWRNALLQRSSVKSAVVDDYTERLFQFFLDRNSVLSERLSLGTLGQWDAKASYVLRPSSKS